MMLFSGSSNIALTHEIAGHLHMCLGRAVTGKFSDGESNAEINTSVRGQDVYVVQSTCAPTNDNLMELLTLIDALRLADAERITAVVPYFGYARQDRKPRGTRMSITARLVAKQLSMAGADRVVVVDIHSEQTLGFFDVPVDNIYALPILLGDVWQHYDNPVIVSPDVGGVVRARAMAKELDNADLAIIDKRRPAPGQSEVMNIIGDVYDRDCVMIDDMVDTAGTLANAAFALKQKGANKVVAYCTHPVLSGRAIRNLDVSLLDELVVSNTIPLNPEAQGCEKIRVVSVGQLLAETVRRLSNNESLCSLLM